MVALGRQHCILSLVSAVHDSCSWAHFQFLFSDSPEFKGSLLTS